MRALALCLALGGCALIGESDCRVDDWRARGYQDGVSGTHPQDLTLASACTRFGVTVDAPRYLEGWRDGHDEWDRIMGSVEEN